MESVYCVWQCDLEERTLLGVFTSLTKAKVYCEEFETNDKNGWYDYYVTEEKVIG